MAGVLLAIYYDGLRSEILQNVHLEEVGIVIDGHQKVSFAPRSLQRKRPSVPFEKGELKSCDFALEDSVEKQRIWRTRYSPLPYP